MAKRLPVRRRLSNVAATRASVTTATRLSEDHLVLQEQLGKQTVAFRGDYSLLPPTDVYFLTCQLQNATWAEMILPPGAYVVLAQTSFHNFNETTSLFQCQLRYPQRIVWQDDTGDHLQEYRTEITHGELTGLANYNFLSTCAFSSESAKYVQLGAAAAENVGVTDVKITAVRVGSVKVIQV